MKTFKKIQIVIIGIFILIGMSNCSQNASYVEGELLFSPKDLVSLESLITSFEEYDDDLNLIYLNGYKYKIENPIFDEVYYSDIIDSKEYLNHGDLISSAFKLDTKMKFSIRFFGIGPEELIDWIETKEEFGLTQLEDGFEVGKLMVEIGKEEEWIETLKLNPLIKFVQLNHIVEPR